MPRALFGERSLGGPGADYTGENATPLHITSVAGHDALIAGAWVVVLVVVALAAARFTDPNWTLAGVAALFSVGIFFEEMFINTSVVQPRYLVAPAMLLYTALVALMRPRQREGATRARTAVRWLPVAGFAVLLVVAMTLNFRVTNGRTTSPAWTSVVATASKRLHHAGRLGVYLCARVVVCNDPLQQGRVRYPARTGCEINVTQSFSGTRHACLG